MAYIIEVSDPYQPLVGMKRHVHPGGISIRGWLEMTYPGFVEFAEPTVCLVNGEPVLRSDWTREIRSNDIVNFIKVVGSEVLIILYIIFIIVAVVLAVTTKPPDTPGELPASSPVFSAYGKINTIRLGEPIEVNYGRNAIYPSLAARPFFRYEGNDQFQFALLCVGQGLYQVHDIFIGETSIDNFEEVSYEIIEPGETVTLFDTNVGTSLEVGGQTLLGINEPTYVAPGWVGPFVTNAPGTEIRRIEIDINLPLGLYWTNRMGLIDWWWIKLEFEYRPIDGTGAPLGPFVLFSIPQLNEWPGNLIVTPIAGKTIIMKTTTPQRITVGNDVTPGRYEMRARKLTKTLGGGFGADKVIWEAMRGVLVQDDPGEVIDFGNVTLLAVKIRASNNLNSRTQERFNVVATRKLPMRESGGVWSEPVATRSIIWAFVDIFRSVYGGRIVDDKFFDWDALEVLDALYAGRSEFFDWTFRDPITVWDAAKAVARVGRAVPLLSGSLITMRRDGPLEVPVTLFTPDNIVKGSFVWEIKLWEPNDHDSISMEYTESETDYNQENVLCTLPGGTTDHPEDIRIPGVQSRAHAYREGLFLLASRRYLRENITFETGLEGFIPSYGDLVAIAHDVPRWAQYGYILAVEEFSGGQFLLHVSEPLRFEESGQYQVLLRGSKSEPLGPYDAEEQSDPKQVLITVEDSEVDFLLGGKNEPMIFLFGILAQEMKQGKVVKIEPQGGERIKITLTNDAPVIHTFDDLEPPPLESDDYPNTPDLPTITSLNAQQLPGFTRVIASWTAAPGASYYIVQYSFDNEGSWNLAGNPINPSLIFDVQPGDVLIRVAGVGAGQGPWVYAEVTVSSVLGLEVTVPWEALEWAVAWWADAGVERYQVRIYDNMDDENPVLKRTEEGLFAAATFGSEYLYDFDKATTDGNLVRRHRIEIDVMFDPPADVEEIFAITGFPAFVDLENSIPAAPLHSDYEFVEEQEPGVPGWAYLYHFFWDTPEEDDLITVKLWLSTTQGFDPAVVAPVETFTDTPGWENLVEEFDHPFELLAGNVHPDLYWRVGLFDVWGNETSTNLTGEQVIAPPWLLTGGIWEDINSRWRDDEDWID